MKDLALKYYYIFIIDLYISKSLSHFFRSGDMILDLPNNTNFSSFCSITEVPLMKPFENI